MCSTHHEKHDDAPHYCAETSHSPKAPTCFEPLSAKRKAALFVLFLGVCSWALLLSNASAVSIVFERGTTLYRPPKHASKYAMLLGVNSMWGLGADARRPLQRLTRVPLVTWSQEAVETLKKHYWQIQNPDACDRVLYIYPMYWGLTSQMRDYSDAAIIALGARRTIHFVSDGWRPQYCAEDTWLECFFEPLSGKKCRRASVELRDFLPYQPSSLDDLIDKLHSDDPVIHLKPGRYFDFIVGSSLGFPSDLWRQLLESHNVNMWDMSGQHVNVTALEKDNPRLYHTLALSALRTMLAPIMFAPNKEIRTLAQARATELMRHSRRPHCVAVHLRWTDKKTDGGVAAKMNFSVDHVATALDRLHRLMGHSYHCLLLLSDDDAAASDALYRRLGGRYDIKTISRVRELFTAQEDYDEYRQKGHTHIMHVFPSRDSAMAYAYTREVFIDIHTAALTAEFLVGPGSSGVSQLLAQYMGSRRRVDANSVALWQEDILMVNA